MSSRSCTRRSCGDGPRRSSNASRDRDLKGEVAVVVEGEHDPDPPESAALLTEVQGLVQEGMRARDAARTVAERHGASANELYQALVSED